MPSAGCSVSSVSAWGGTNPTTGSGALKRRPDNSPWPRSFPDSSTAPPTPNSITGRYRFLLEFALSFFGWKLCIDTTSGFASRWRLFPVQPPLVGAYRAGRNATGKNGRHDGGQSGGGGGRNPPIRKILFLLILYFLDVHPEKREETRGGVQGLGEGGYDRPEVETIGCWLEGQGPGGGHTAPSHQILSVFQMSGLQG